MAKFPCPPRGELLSRSKLSWIQRTSWREIAISYARHDDHNCPGTKTHMSRLTYVKTDGVQTVKQRGWGGGWPIAWSPAESHDRKFHVPARDLFNFMGTPHIPTGAVPISCVCEYRARLNNNNYSSSLFRGPASGLICRRGKQEDLLHCNHEIHTYYNGEIPSTLLHLFWCVHVFVLYLYLLRTNNYSCKTNIFPGPQRGISRISVCILLQILTHQVEHPLTADNEDFVRSTYK